jgi:hypothetical protein
MYSYGVLGWEYFRVAICDRHMAAPAMFILVEILVFYLDPSPLVAVKEIARSLV